MAKIPNLFFIGGMRCGSTSLYLLLSQHPEIYMSQVKEPRHWGFEAARLRGAPVDRTLYPYADRAAYDALFDPASDEPWIGEASHYIYQPEAIDLIAKASPDARIIVSLRDPFERLYSEYLFSRRSELVDGTFEEFVEAKARIDASGQVVDVDPKSRLNKSKQGQLLAPWIERFGQDRVHVLFFDELEKNPLQVAGNIYRWLGVDADFEPKVVHTQKSGIPKHKGIIKALNTRIGIMRAIKRAMPRLMRERIRAFVYARTLERPKAMSETEGALRDFFKEDIAQLEQLTERDLSHWKGGN